MLDAILVLWVGVADRVRGGFPDDTLFEDEKVRAWKNHIRHAIKFTPGMALGLLIDAAWWEVLAAGVLFKFGEQLAGNFGRTFRHLIDPSFVNTFELVRVGFLWGCLPAMLFWVGDMGWGWLPVATTLGSLLGGLMAHFPMPDMPKVVLELDSPPAYQEFWRGIFTALIFAAP